MTDSDQEQKIREAKSYARQGETYRLMVLQMQEPYDTDQALSDAKDAFQKAINQAPNSKYAWANAHLGATYSLIGARTAGDADKDQNYQNAIDNFNKAIDLKNQDYAWAYAQLGQAFLLWGCDYALKDSSKAIEKLTSAIAAFSTAIEQDSQYAWAYAHRGMTYRVRGILHGESDPTTKEHPYYDLALKDFQQAINFSQGKYAWAWAYKFVVHKAKKEWQEACEAVQKAVEIYPGIFDRPVLYNNSPLYPPAHLNAVEAELVEKKLQDNPIHPLALYVRAASKAVREGTDAAQDEIKKAHEAGV